MKRPHKKIRIFNILTRHYIHAFTTNSKGIKRLKEEATVNLPQVCRKKLVAELNMNSYSNTVGIPMHISACFQVTFPKITLP